MRMTKHIMGAVVAAGLLIAPATFAQRANDPTADALIGSDERFQPVIAEHGMVAAQDRIAAEVGRDILRQGGNAVDAAVATGFALAVTHPQAGNLGGGGFMVIALRDKRKVTAIDYRETAPKGATRDMFLDAKGEVDKQKSQASRAAAGVPGTVAGLLYALDHYGTMPRDRVMAPAIRLADDGFKVPYGLAYAFSKSRERFARDASSVAYFEHPGGEPYKAGEILRQPDLGATLRAIRDRGVSGYYDGPVADEIVAEMKQGGGLITLDDLKEYKPVEREPVRGLYRGYEIVSMPPPSSGGTHLIEMLNILEGYDLKALGHDDADMIHRLAEAMRRAYADRAKYMGDPDFIRVPVARLVSKEYAAQLRAGIDLRHATKSADLAAGETPPSEGEQTTHFSVMDSFGNAVANTFTLNAAFGSGYSVDGAGFLLNNEMDDFSAKPGVPNEYGLVGGEANAIAPGKRPLSSMTPTIVLKDRVPLLATGSPGGGTIINVVLQELLNILTFNMNVAAATAAPRVHHQWLPDVLTTEPGISDDTLRILESRGFILPKNPDGSFQHRILGRANTVMRRNGLFFGAADTRDADGAVAGY